MVRESRLFFVFRYYYSVSKLIPVDILIHIHPISPGGTLQKVDSHG